FDIATSFDGVPGSGQVLGDVRLGYEITKTDTTTATQVHDASHTDITGTSVALGTAVHDSATVGTQVNGFVIGGTVTYTLHAGLDGTGAGIGSPETVAVGTEATAQTLGAGNYSYTVHYSGDANYNPSDSAAEPF